MMPDSFICTIKAFVPVVWCWTVKFNPSSKDFFDLIIRTTLRNHGSPFLLAGLADLYAWEYLGGRYRELVHNCVPDVCRQLQPAAAASVNLALCYRFHVGAAQQRHYSNKNHIHKIDVFLSCTGLSHGQHGVGTEGAQSGHEARVRVRAARRAQAGLVHDARGGRHACAGSVYRAADHHGPVPAARAVCWRVNHRASGR